MELTKKESLKVEVTRVADSYSLTCFQETPRKTGDEKPLARIGAFDLFNLFTANIIRSNEIFTR